MNKLGIKYCGPLLDGSGYAQFARNFVTGLSARDDIDLSTQTLSFESARPALGATQRLIDSLNKKKISYDIKIINAIPDMLPKLVEPEKKNVCFTMFETNRIPKIWVDMLNKYSDACLVPCLWNKEVFKDSGVDIPIYVVAPGIDINEYSMSNIDSINLANLPDDAIAFYSIFQWTERKNPIGLITAFLAAFDNVQDAYLIVKTYGSDFSIGQQNRISEMIQRIKQQMRLVNPPKILFIGSLLSISQILSLHQRGDCFVLPHRAEGFGMPHLEAMAAGNPVIATGFSGNMDFMNKDNSYLLDYQMTVVSNMPWIPYYEADMEWAEPNLSQLKKYMRQVYEDIKLAKQNKYTVTRALASRGQKDVTEKFNLDTAADRLIKVCQEINNV